MSHPNAPGIVIHYTDLRTITDDVSDARVFGGIHFRYDQEPASGRGARTLVGTITTTASDERTTMMMVMMAIDLLSIMNEPTHL